MQPVKRVFFVGPPGSNCAATAEALATDMDWKYVSAGKALQAEVDKGSAQGKAIEKAQKKFKLIDDDIVIDVISKEI